MTDSKPAKAEHANLQHEPSPVNDPCNLFALRRAARAASRLYARIMRDTGLKESQFSILVFLSEMGPLSISALAEATGTERTSMSRTLTPLERENLISVSDEGFRRTREVNITEAGRERLQQAMPLWREAQEAFKSQFQSGEVDVLQKLLGQVADGAAAPE